MAPILETIFSLVFVILVFSLITSWIVEYLSMRNERRGKMLRQFITDALDDPFNKPWAPLLYSHPLIDVLHRYIDRPRGWLRIFYNNKLGVKRRLPAYIPSDQFATALVDVICQSGREIAFLQNRETGQYQTTSASAVPVTFLTFYAALNALKPSDLKTTLLALSQQVKADDDTALVQIHALVAKWYDNGMERLNGWYKRATRPWLFWVGLVVAVAFNVDALRLIDRFYNNPQLRGSVVRAADRYLEKRAAADSVFQTGSLDTLRQRIDSLTAMLAPLNLPIGWEAELKPYPPYADTSNVLAWISYIGRKQGWRFRLDARDSVRARDSARVRDTGLYLPDPANRHGYLSRKWQAYVARPLSIAGSQAGESWLGWLLTAFALSFGAPFWFDALRKISNVRSTGLKPAETTASSSR